MASKFYKQSELTRMIVVAIIGVVASFITYEIIYYFNPFSPRITVSWILAFIIGVARQHALHRWFTFLYKTPYFKSLLRAYIVDSGTLIFSSILSWFLSEVLLLDHRMTWFICLLSTALISFIFLKTYVFKKTPHLH